MQGGDAAGADLVEHFLVEVARELGRGPDDGVAAVVALEHQRLRLVGEEDEVHVVALVVGADVLRVDANPFAGDQALQLVFRVIQLHARDDFVGDEEELARGPVVEFILDGGLVDDAAVLAIDGHDGLEKQVLAGALRAVQHERCLHLGAGILDRVGQPAQHPLVKRGGVVVFVAAEVFEQLKKALAAPSPGLSRPAAPQVALDAVILAGGIEADLGLPHDGLLAAFHPLPVQLAADAQIAHRGERHELVLLPVEDGLGHFIDEAESLLQLLDVFDGAEIVTPPPLIVCGRRCRPRCRRGNPMRREVRLELGAHHLLPFDDGEVVEVGDLLPGAILGEGRRQPGAADLERRGAGGSLAGVAFGEVVVVGGDDEGRPRVALLQRLGHGREVAGIEGHGDRQAGCLMDRGGGGVALCHHAAPGDRPEQKEVPLLRQAGRPEILVAAVFLLAAHQLHAVHLAGNVAHRHDELPAVDRAVILLSAGDGQPVAGEAHAVRLDLLAAQVGTGALARSRFPQQPRQLGRPCVVFLARSLGRLAIGIELRPQRLALLR